VPARVTRTFVNDVAHVLDFHGTGVTPGHAFLCGAGRFQGRHVPLLDILRDDGAMVRGGCMDRRPNWRVWRSLCLSKRTNTAPRRREERGHHDE
jgi:hypothetical protein